MKSKIGHVVTPKNYRAILSYFLIGLTLNCCIYGVYLFITHFFGWVKFTMTLLYLVAAVMNFFANRRFTFQDNGKIGSAGARFIGVQAVGYVFNLTILILFVDWLEFPHQIVQAISIILVAVFLFVSMQIFVFKQSIHLGGGNSL